MRQNQSKMKSNKNSLQTGLIYGSLLGIVVISIGIIRYKTGMILRDNQTLSYVYWGIFTMTIFYAIFQFKKLNPLSFSYKQTLLIGLFAGLISGLMYTIYIVILNGYIDPELASKIIEYKEQTISNPVATVVDARDTADSIKIMQMNSLWRGLVYTCVCMFFGVIHAFIATIVAKKSPFIK